MNYIKEIIQKKEPSIDELIKCFEEVKRDGNVGVIKFDGEREHTHYTVFISFPNFKINILRADEDNLTDALVKVLTMYIERANERH